jgi:serine/threonine protein kinase
MGDGDRLGQQVGNYRLARLLGSGGFAQVYLGKQIYLDSEAAIKLLRADLTQGEFESFRREARTLARLVHPHIVRLLDFGLDKNTPFLVMDYAPNGTMRQHHRRGELFPLDRVVAYVQQVASALQYAHDERIIHRDIKPENMLLGRQGEILLSDFGIAIVAQNTRTQFPQEMTGTVVYMAPEQVQAHPRPASDQYSLGVVAYEWLTGYPPFTGAFTEVALKHIMAEPPPLREKVPTLSPGVERVVLTALAKDPTQRFSTVRAFAQALAQASRGGQVLFPVSPQISQVSTVLSAPVTPILADNSLAAVQTDGLQETLETPTVLTDSAPAAGSIPAGAQAQTPPAFTPPPRPAYNPVTPPVQPPVTTGPATGQDKRRGLSRRAALVGGLALAGTVAAGSITTWALLLSHSSAPDAPVTQHLQTPTPSPVKQPSVSAGLPLAQDTFTRADQLHWGAATLGGDWGGDANVSNDFTIASATGQIHRTLAEKQLYTAVLGVSQTDTEVMAIAMLDLFNPAHIGVVLRYTDDDNYYKTFFDGAGLMMIKRVDGKNTTLQKITFATQANVLYAVRFQVVGSTLRARVWTADLAEPTNWLLTATDPTFLSGRSGLRPQLDQNVTFKTTLFREISPTLS